MPPTSQLQVLNTVIGAIAVDVVDGLIGAERATNGLSHNEAML